MSKKIREKAVAFIVVRLNSSRLPGKHLRSIGNRSLLSWLTGHLHACLELDEIVIATTAEAVNAPLRRFARQNNLSYFSYKGEINQVTTRLVCAAERYSADICLLISGDCPLLHAPLIDSLVARLREDPQADTVKVDIQQGMMSALQGVQVARRRAWQLAEELSDRPEHKEHHFPAIALYPDKFCFTPYRLASEFSGQDLRLSVDTMADLTFMNQLYKELTSNKKPFTLPEVISLLEAKPELKNINAHVHQRALVETIYTVLIIIDSGDGFGFGHLRRCMELGLQITERLSWLVIFVVDDPFAYTLLTENGFTVFWGAMGRPPRNNSNEDIQSFQKTLKYDLVIIDIASRPVHQNWKRNFLQDVPTVIIDKTEDWTLTSDVLIIPGVTCPVAHETWTLLDHPPLLQGKEFIIIRREIHKAGTKKIKKDIDLLIYHGTDEPVDWLEDLCHLKELTVMLVTGTSEQFPDLLARSRVYLSHFGYSFYEALFLKAYPLAWSFSCKQDEDVRLFYQRFSLDLPLIPRNDKGKNRVIDFVRRVYENVPDPKRKQQNIYTNHSERISPPPYASLQLPALQITDGTPTIIHAIKDLIHHPKKTV